MRYSCRCWLVQLIEYITIAYTLKCIGWIVSSEVLAMLLGFGSSGLAACWFLGRGIREGS